jgi:hypothetical protein
MFHKKKAEAGFDLVEPHSGQKTLRADSAGGAIATGTVGMITATVRRSTFCTAPGGRNAVARTYLPLQAAKELGDTAKLA